MNLKSHWIVKLLNQYNHMRLVVYNNGKVFFSHTGPFVGQIKKNYMNKINKYINDYVHYIKYHGYEVNDRRGFIARFWDSSNKKRDDLAVKGWPYEREFLSIIINPKSYRYLRLDDSEFNKLMFDYLSFPGVDDECK